MSKWAARIGAAAVTSVLVLGATACEYPPGTPGKIVKRDNVYKSSTKTRNYLITTRDAEGVAHQFGVSPDDYESCRVGTMYPDCTGR